MGPSAVIPPAFARWTIAREGDAGRAWIARLPGIVDSCLERWRLQPDAEMLHGYVAIALPVLRADRSPAMLRITWPEGSRSHEADALAAWNGGGAVLLMERDDRAGAMLLERLDHTRSVRELDGVAALHVAGQLCRRLDVPAPPGMPKLEDIAAKWIVELPATWDRLGRPFASRPLESAVATCRELGLGQPDRLLHGNLRFDHILRGGREPWLVIDPNGLAGEPAYEVAPLLGDGWKELTARADFRTAVGDRLAAFCDGAGVDPQRARRWAQVYFVAEALWGREHQPEMASQVDSMVDALT